MGARVAHIVRVAITDDWGFWGTIPDWIVVATALFGVAAGVVQLSAIRRSNAQAVQFERAKLLLELDRDFEGPAMVASRQKLLAIRNRFESEVTASAWPWTSEQQLVEVARLISENASRIWANSRNYDGDPAANKDRSAEEYELIMRLPSWCETVGHLCRRELLPLADILDLYDQLVINTVGNLIQHIVVRREHTPQKNQRYLENATWLYEQARQHKAARGQVPPITPDRSGIRWRA